MDRAAGARQPRVLGRPDLGAADLMGYYRSPLDVPTIYQWDASSRLPSPDPGTAPGNCGMTVVTHIANYYRDANFGIYATRRLATSDRDLGTSIGEQSLALRERGVPNIIDRPTVAQIRKYLSTGRRPIAVGLDMSRVPMEYAGHPFRGHHGALLRANRVRNEAPAFDLMDPNFNRTYRQDPTKGHRQYPTWVLESAYYNAGMWAIVPLNDKQVPPPWYGRVRVAGPGVSIRESAKEFAGNVWAKSRTDGWTYREADGRRLFRNSYLYYWDGERVKGPDGIEYFRVRTHAGNTKFIRVGAAAVVRKA